MARDEPVSQARHLLTRHKRKHHGLRQTQPRLSRCPERHHPQYDPQRQPRARRHLDSPLPFQSRHHSRLQLIDHHLDVQSPHRPGQPPHRNQFRPGTSSPFYRYHEQRSRSIQAGPSLDRKCD